ncbi:MAG: tetratricopeptide repeat protein [Bacteroidia bacterium]|nr:tetratricopeptide repeat protein [Bacteroidia bacterium]
MRFFSKIIPAAILITAYSIYACNNNKESSPFGNILSQAPFDGLTDSISKFPGHDELYFRRAVLFNKNNFPEPALADFQKAWSLQKEEPYALGISTILLEKNPDSAIAFLNQAIKEIPNSLLLQLSLARNYDAQNKTDDALAVCNEILQKNPMQVDALKMKADLLYKKDNMAESTVTLEKAYSLTPFDLDLNYQLASQYAESKNAKVIALCDSLIKKDSMQVHAEPYYFKGLYYSYINDKAKAIALFNQAIRHNYNYLNAYIGKGRALFDQQKFNEALKVFQLSQTISPSFADAYYWIGRCQEATGQKDEARLNYQRAYGLDRTFIEAKEAADRIKK